MPTRYAFLASSEEVVHCSPVTIGTDCARAPLPNSANDRKLSDNSVRHCGLVAITYSMVVILSSAQPPTASGGIQSGIQTGSICRGLLFRNRRAPQKLEAGRERDQYAPCLTSFGSLPRGSTQSTIRRERFNVSGCSLHKPVWRPFHTSTL